MLGTALYLPTRRRTASAALKRSFVDAFSYGEHQRTSREREGQQSGHAHRQLVRRLHATRGPAAGPTWSVPPTSLHCCGHHMLPYGIRRRCGPAADRLHPPPDEERRSCEDTWSPAQCVAAPSWRCARLRVCASLLGPLPSRDPPPFPALQLSVRRSTTCGDWALELAV